LHKKRGGKKIKQLKLNPLYFGAGNERHVHRGFCRQNAKKEYEVVLKRFFRATCLNQYTQSHWEQNIATFMADQYNQHRDKSLANIKFMSSFVIKLYGGQFMHMETKLPECNWEFHKYVNNIGVWSTHLVELLPPCASKSLTAFVFWCNKATSHKLMVADLQGVYHEEDNAFYLTDPVITTSSFIDFRTSGTNWGEAAMTALYDSSKFIQERIISIHK